MKKKLVVLRASDGRDAIYKWVADHYRFGIQKRTRGNPRTSKEKKRYYSEAFCAFDIETTNYKPMKQSWMYMWSFCLDKYTIIGRTWEQARWLFEELALYLMDQQYIICWVHNLSFEWQFLKSVFDKELSEVFALDNRKLVKFTILDHIEFRCSYILTNNNLSQFTGNMGIKHRKLDGAKFDYRKLRFSDSDIKKYELMYSWYDVLGLVEALKVYFKTVGCNFYNIPITNTGFVRNDLKKSIREGCRYSYMRSIQPDLELLHALHDAFRGGDVHGNRYYTGRVVTPKDLGFEGLILGDDRESSYPAEMFNKNYPMKFTRVGPVSWIDLISRLRIKKMAAVLVIEFLDVELKDEFNPDPYLSYSKCRYVREEVLDNGRIVSARSLQTTITDVDLRIILSEYHGKMRILDSWFSTYKPLPEAVKDVLRKYGQAKTALKGVKGEELNYQVAKGRFNSIYGCCVMYPLRPILEYKFGDHDYKEFLESDEKTEEELLDKYNKKGFLPYQWGVWVTAWARYELRRGMHIVGHKQLYVDTDSIKYIPDPDISFEAYNEEMIELARKNNSVFIDKNGEEHYLGRFLREEEMESFCTLGAKKYCYMEKGQLHLTLAGVSKKKGAYELSEQEGIYSFKVGTVFHNSAGLTATYNDKEDRYINVNGHRIHLISNLYLEPTEYTLTLSPDYERITQICSKIWNNELKRENLLTK